MACDNSKMEMERLSFKNDLRMMFEVATARLLFQRDHTSSRLDGLYIGV